MIRYFGPPYRNATVLQNIMRHFIFQELHKLKGNISHPGVLHDSGYEIKCLMAAEAELLIHSKPFFKIIVFLAVLLLSIYERRRSEIEFFQNCRFLL